jgi:hypothetical protein
VPQEHLVARHDAEPAVGHADVRGTVRFRLEAFDVILRRDDLHLGPVAFVGDNAEVHVENDAEKPVAAEDERKELRVFGPAASRDRAVRFHEAQRFDGGGDRRVVVLPTVAVDADRAADAEVVVRLHDGRGKSMGIEKRHDVGPAGAGADAQNPLVRLQVHAPKRQHIEDDAAGVDRVPAHAMPRAGDRHRKLLPSRSLQEEPQLAFGLRGLGGNGPDLRDVGAVEPARVVGLRRGGKFLHEGIMAPFGEPEPKGLATERKGAERESRDAGPSTDSHASKGHGHKTALNWCICDAIVRSPEDAPQDIIFPAPFAVMLVLGGDARLSEWLR